MQSFVTSTKKQVSCVQFHNKSGPIKSTGLRG